MRFRGDVEGLRGVAVLAVVLYHAGLAGTGGGFVGVDVFFVISGFLISGLLWAEIERTGRVSFGAFYGRRARRLLPAAVLVLVVTVIVSAAVLSPLQARDVIKDAEAAALYVANYRFAALRTDYLAAAAPSPIQHYWSLAVEEQFYLVWPLLMLLGASVLPRRLGWPKRPTAGAVLGVVAIGSFLLSLRLTHDSEPWAFFSLPTRAWELTAGAAVAMAVPWLTRIPRLAAALIGWVGFGAIVWSVVRFSASTAFPGTAALVPVGGAALMLAAGCAAPARGASLLLRARPLQRAGRISYSWYLWHWPALILVPAMVGHSLNTLENLALVGLSALLATATVAFVEDPVRFARSLTTNAGWSLGLGGSLSIAALVSILLIGISLPRLQGAKPVAALKPLSSTPTASATGSLTQRLAVADAPLVAAVEQGAATRAVPSNLEPSLGNAHGDKALPFLDGCNATYSVTTVSRCEYGDTQAATSIVLFGDSHATQWFPALDAIANLHHWRLIVLAKTTCPPLEISVWSPVLGRAYSECDQFRRAALARIRAERPALVVIGVARHYSSDYHFQVYGPQWIQGFATIVREIRAMGTRVVVLGPTPKPNLTDVPSCLSAHLSDATACTTPRAVAVNAAGFVTERAAVLAAGGSYVDVTPWVCTSATCAVIVGNLLVYRDDNHLTTSYVSWLTPEMNVALDLALGSRKPVYLTPG
jgi:peptidoglycan/LPS O-acetylase OafA/YrhL